MISHLNVISGNACDEYMGYNFTQKDVVLSYVPMSHI
jgi:hypothetical protein